MRPAEKQGLVNALILMDQVRILKFILMQQRMMLKLPVLQKESQVIKHAN